MIKYSVFYFRFYLTNVFEIFMFGEVCGVCGVSKLNPQNNFISKLQPLLNQVLR